jgi:hypothetical protein
MEMRAGAGWVVWFGEGLGLSRGALAQTDAWVLRKLSVALFTAYRRLAEEHPDRGSPRPGQGMIDQWLIAMCSAARWNRAAPNR